MFELYNADVWPLQVIALLAGTAIFVLMRSRMKWRGRAIAAILAVCWLWIAWAFHWQRYATINWLAPYFAALFAVEALLLVWIAFRDRLTFDRSHSFRARAGVAIFLFALVAQPLIGLLVRREWMQVEIFGMTPDPTAVATIGLLLAASRFNWLAGAIPVLWCVFSGLTLYVLSSQ